MHKDVLALALALSEAQRIRYLCKSHRARVGVSTDYITLIEEAAIRIENATRNTNK